MTLLILALAAGCGGGEDPQQTPSPSASGTPIHAEARPLPTPGEDVDPRVRALLPDAADRRWEQLPWYDDLLVARAAAEKSGAPIFMWIMDGNPLGPT